MLHILDSLIERGHQVFVYKRNGKRGEERKLSTDQLYNPLDYTRDPWDIDRVGPDTLVYLCEHLGLKVKHLSDITWISSSSEKVFPKLVLGTDRVAFGSKKQINLPYNEFYCRTLEQEFLVGNGMCEELRNRQREEPEREGQLLITHPGGGRGIVSPHRRHIPKMKVVDNNITLFNNILFCLPDNVRKVVIKIHPAPYVNCDKKAFASFVKPRLISKCEIEVAASDLIGHTCRSQYVLTFGSSTILWLLGSDKKWVNLIGGVRDTRLWPDRDLWPQNIGLKQLKDALSDYTNYCTEKIGPKWQGAKERWQERYNMPCRDNVVNLIEKGSL